MKRKTLFIFLLCSFALSGQNVMSLSSATVFRSDTAMVELKISNSQPFVAFQTDIQFPAELTALPQSGALTGRSNGHAFSCQFVPGNVIRIIAFSLNQSPFLGDSGAVFRFKVVAGNATGTYIMRIVDPVISNANSQNIITGSTNGNITIIDSVVKVELVSFNAIHTSDNIVSLNWETSTEENALRFHIERITESSDMCRSFIVDASGTSTVPRTYSLTDDVSGVSGKILYRLWEEDANGSRTLLGEKEIEISSTEQGLMLFQNYPNPFKEGTTIRFYSGAVRPVEMVITNINGEAVRKYSFPAASIENNTLYWNGENDYGSHLGSGIYFLKWNNNGKLLLLKIVLIE